MHLLTCTFIILWSVGGAIYTGRTGKLQTVSSRVRQTDLRLLLTLSCSFMYIKKVIMITAILKIL